MNDEDGILIQKYLDGDEDAFTELMKKHIDSVYAFSLRLTGDAHIAEDATQQTFINAWKRLASYDVKRRLITWLLAIARNASIDILRKKKGVPLSYFETDEGGNAVIDTTKDPEPLPRRTLCTQRTRGGTRSRPRTAFLRRTRSAHTPL